MAHEGKARMGEQRSDIAVRAGLQIVDAENRRAAFQQGGAQM
jgi:hypothetical protein